MSKVKIGVATIGPRIYLGPNISGTALMHNMVFKDELPDFATQLIAECPEVGKLLVPVRNFDEAQRDVNTQGTYRAQMYKIVADKFAKRGDN